MSDIFLSYSREDLDFARKLAGKLEEVGWSVWWDKKIPAGKTFAQFIKQHLDEARCVIVIWSAHSVQSDWVANEAAEGARRKILAPVIIENAEVPFEFQRIQALNLSDWDGTKEYSEFAELVVSIQDIVPLPDAGEVHVKKQVHEEKGIGHEEEKKEKLQTGIEEIVDVHKGGQGNVTVPVPARKKAVTYKHVIAFISVFLFLVILVYSGYILGLVLRLGLMELTIIGLIWGIVGAFVYDFISRDKKSKKPIFISLLIFFFLFFIVYLSNINRTYHPYYEGHLPPINIFFNSIFYSVPIGAVIGMIYFKQRRKHLRSKVK